MRSAASDFSPSTRAEPSCAARSCSTIRRRAPRSTKKEISGGAECDRRDCGRQAFPFIASEARSLADHFGGHRGHLHLAEPGADVGGQPRIGRHGGEVGGLAGAEPDAGEGNQAIGGGNHVAGAQRGVEREIDRRQP